MAHSGNVTIYRDTENFPTSGMIKNHLIFYGQIHHNCPSLAKFVDEERKTLNRFWCASYLKEQSVAISQAQCWFAGLPSTKKLKFVRKIIKGMNNTIKLFAVLYFVGPPTKDAAYADSSLSKKSRPEKTREPRRPKKEKIPIENRESEYLVWFESLNPQEKFNTIVGFLHLGESSLQRTIYSDLHKIAEQKEMNRVKRKVLEYMAQKRNMHDKPSAVVSSKVSDSRTVKWEKNILKTTKQKEKLKENTKTKAGCQDVGLTALKNKIDSFEKTLLAMKEIANNKIDGDSKNGKKIRRSGGKMDDEINCTTLPDRVQLLPIWLNRRIISYLPATSIDPMSRVNKYWKDMTDRTKKELLARNTLDETLGRIAKKVIQ